MRDLTMQQMRVLRFIAGHVDRVGWPPTLREIGDHMGIRSTNGVNDHLVALERKGMIERSGFISRGIRISPKGWIELGARVS